MKRQGIALITALIAILLVAGIGALIVTRTLAEIRHSRDDYSIVRALMLARGGANATGALMTSAVRAQLKNVVEARADTSSAWAFGDDTGKGYPDPVSTSRELLQVANDLQTRVDALLCSFAPKPDKAPGSVSVRLYFTRTACGNSLPSGTELGTPRFVAGTPRLGAGVTSSQTYALPFVLVSEARLGPYKRNIVLQGEYRFSLGRSSFARYALFTNVHTLPGGSNVWFTDRTLFDGPVHTNHHFRFYHQPWFGGEVTSAGCTDPGDTSCEGEFKYGARFYGEGFVRDEDMTPSSSAPRFENDYGVQAPEFKEGVDWRADFVRLPLNNNIQKQAAKHGGLYFPRRVEELELYTGTENGVTYQFIQVVTYNKKGKQVTRKFRYRSDGHLEIWRPKRNTWEKYRDDPFNGVIFADEDIAALHGPSRTDHSNPDTADPALAPFAQITIASTHSIRITGDLKYSERPCSKPPERDENGNVVPAVCNNLNAKNVLGVYSQEGDVLIGRNAPQDINIDAVLMSARGVVQVEDYNYIQPKGSVYLTGGIIEYYYGAFGTFDPYTGQNASGYGRRFTYDRRMQRGLAPPYFPTTQLDQVRSVTFFSYGQREQVY